MKIASLFILSLTLTSITYGQTEDPNITAPQQVKSTKKAKSKQVYELPEKTEYEIFDDKGVWLEKGNAKRIDFSAYAPGIYYIRYNDKTFKYENVEN